MPPCAATYWSCLPTGSLRTSISISQAASASAPGVIEVRRACASPFSRQTVNAPEEPIPVPAGTSATEAISSGLPRQWREQRLAQDRVLDLGDLVDLLGLGVLHPVAALEDRVGQHVDVLVDRPGDEEAAVLAVVGRQVGAAAAERDAQRGAAEDDAHRGARLPVRSTIVRGWPRTSRACARSPRGMVSVGAQPSARICAQSRWISGQSPAQPRLPPVCSISGCDAHVRRRSARPSRRRRPSRRCRGCRRARLAGRASWASTAVRIAATQSPT